MASEFDEHSGVISPNDRWLAYVSNETGREDVYLTRFPALDGKQVVSPDGGNEPVWARDGSELFYRSGDKLMAVRVEAGSPLSTPIVLFEGRYQLSHTFRGADYDVTPDGRFVMTKPVEADSALQMHVVLNWFVRAGAPRPHESTVIRSTSRNPHGLVTSITQMSPMSSSQEK